MKPQAVPSHVNGWRTLPLKRLGSFRAGNGIESGAIEESGSFPVFGGNGLRGYTTTYTHHGDFVLVGRQGALCGNVNYASGKFYATEHAIVVDPRPEVDVRWLGELLWSLNLGQYSQAAAQPGIAVDVVENLRVAVPPYQQQQAIAHYLAARTARIDALIAAEQARSHNAQERLVSAIEAVVLGRSRNEAVVNDPEGPLRPHPAHWSIRRNKTFMDEVVDLSRTGQEELLTVSHVTGVTPRSEKTVYMFLAESNEGYKRVRPNDLVINTMWAWMGALGVSSHDGIVSPAYGVYRFTSSDADPHYFDALFRTPAYVAEMTRYSTGVWTSRLRLYPESFLGLRSPFPPVREQRAIADSIEELRSEQSRLETLLTRSVDLLTERRQALTIAALTGQLAILGSPRDDR